MTEVRSARSSERRRAESNSETMCCASVSGLHRTRMKVRSSLKSLKNQPGSQVVRRRGRIYGINKQNPRFKARQG